MQPAGKAGSGGDVVFRQRYVTRAIQGICLLLIFARLCCLFPLCRSLEMILLTQFSACSLTAYLYTTMGMVSDQEQGLDVEDMRVRSLEAMRRLFVLVLLTALFVAHLAVIWPQPAVTWLRSLGGKLGLPTDLDGLYLFLAGISFIFTTAATLSFAFAHPFPFFSFTYG